MNISTKFDELSAGFAKTYERYNGFYRRPDVRETLYDLYGGKCAATGEEIALSDAEVGHIVPRSQPGLFESLYPGLDVDNAINLHLISKDVNRRNRDGLAPSPHAIHNAISYSARLVENRLPKLMMARKNDRYSGLKRALEAYPDSEYSQRETRSLEQYEHLKELLTQKKGPYVFMSTNLPKFNLDLIARREGIRRPDYGMFENGRWNEGNLGSEIEGTLHERKLLKEQFTGIVYQRREVTRLVKAVERHLDYTNQKIGAYTSVPPTVGMPS